VSSHPSFEPLPGPEGQTTPVLRHGDTVLRPAGPWTPTVHALLIHLENAGFSGSPRVVGNGYDGHGREVLTYIPGEFVHPHAWSDEGIWQVGRLLHDLHDATADFQPAPDAVWHRWPFHSDAPDAIISHRDTGHWNIVARDGLPVAFIDWDSAQPVDPVADLADAAWAFLPLAPADQLAQSGFDPLPDLPARLRLFVDAYGLTDRSSILAALQRSPLATAEHVKYWPIDAAGAANSLEFLARELRWIHRLAPDLARAL
jgi:hypothetical protein